MSDTIEITLAGTAYKIRRLTLGQLRSLTLDVVKESLPKDAPAADRLAEAWDADEHIVSLALARDYPDVSANLSDQESTRAEIQKAALAILRFSGLVPEEGEGGAPVKAA